MSQDSHVEHPVPGADSSTLVPFTPGADSSTLAPVAFDPCIAPSVDSSAANPATVIALKLTGEVDEEELWLANPVTRATIMEHIDNIAHRRPGHRKAFVKLFPADTADWSCDCEVAWYLDHISGIHGPDDTDSCTVTVDRNGDRVTVTRVWTDVVTFALKHET